MVFNPEHQQPSKRIVLPRIDLTTEDVAPQRNGETRSPTKSPSKLPLRVDDSKVKQTHSKTKVHEHTFRGERDVFLNKGLTSGAQLGRDRTGAEYSYRIENFFHNVGSDIFDTPSTDETHLKKSPSDADFFSKAAARCGEDKFNELLKDGVERLNNSKNDEEAQKLMTAKVVKDKAERKLSAEKQSGIPTLCNKNTNNSNNAKDVDKESNIRKIVESESEGENAKEVGDEKNISINEDEVNLPEEYLTEDMTSKGLEHDSKLKRLWRDMLRWKGISVNERSEDSDKRKAVNFEEFHAVLEFLKY